MRVGRQVVLDIGDTADPEYDVFDWAWCQAEAPPRARAAMTLGRWLRSERIYTFAPDTEGHYTFLLWAGETMRGEREPPCDVTSAHVATGTGGARSAALQASAEPGGVVLAELRGTATTPQLLAPRSATAFDSDGTSFTVTNVGMGAGPPVLSIGGANPKDFVMIEPCVGVPFPPGGACSFLVFFHPTAAGLRSATLSAMVGTISDSVPLSATAPGIAITPANPTVKLGQALALKATLYLASSASDDATASVTWTSGNSDVLIVSNTPPSAGLLFARLTGVATVTAAITLVRGAPVVSGSTVVTVIP